MKRKQIQTWPVDVQLPGEQGWRPARLTLYTDGSLALWLARPFKRIDPSRLQSIYTPSLLARIVLLRRGWPLTSTVERYGHWEDGARHDA